VRGVRWWRRARGLTQRELSALSGVQQRTISRLESGMVEEPRTSTLLRLAGALEVEPFDLMFGEHSVGLFGPPEGLMRPPATRPESPPPEGDSSPAAGTQERTEDIPVRVRS
jgi:transcriptional regulator with XRE-family HTH domain